MPRRVTRLFAFEELGSVLGAEGPFVVTSTEVEQRRRRMPTKWSAALGIVVCVLFPFGYGLFSLHLGEDIGWDTLDYHFFISFWWFDDHLRDIAPAQVQTFLSPMLDLPNYLLIRALSAREAVFFIATIQGLAFPPLYFFARRITGNRAIALVLAGLGMFSAVAWSEIGTSIGDNLDSIPFLISLALVARSLDSEPGSRSRNWWLVGAGVCAGIGGGLKLALVPISIGFAIAVLLLDRSIRARLFAAVRFGGGVVVGLVVSYGYFAYELGRRFGNPILPFYNDLFRSKYAPFDVSSDVRWLPHGIFQWFFYPFVWTLHPLRVGEEPFRELSLPICEALLLLALVIRFVLYVKTRHWRPMFETPLERFFVVGAAFAELIWAREFGVYRYIVAIEMLGFVLMWVLVRSCVRAIGSSNPYQWFCYGAIVALSVLCVATEAPANWIRAPFGAKYFTVPVPKRFERAPSTILMLTSNPYSYIVPFFPTDTDFIRLEGNLLPTAYVAGQIRERLHDATNVYIMWVDPIPYATREEFLANDAGTWEQYGLRVVAGTCALMTTHLGTDIQHFRYCRVAPGGAVS